MSLGREPARATLDVDQYLKAHGFGSYRIERIRNPFEHAVQNELKPHTSEIVSCVRAVALNSLEIDLVIRCGNQFGVAELKTGAEATRKAPIDQLNSATGREFLGTYTRRFLIINRNLPRENREPAAAYRIEVIELCDDLEAGRLSADDRRKLIAAVTSALGRPPRG